MVYRVSRSSIIGVGMFLLTLGCKDVVVLDKTTQFAISLDLYIEKDDTFEVYYTSSENEKYNRNQRVVTKVYGQPRKQKVEIDLPEGVYPASLRLDFGTNRQQEFIRLDDVEMHFGEVSVLEGLEEFRASFAPNAFIEAFSKAGEIRFMNSGNRYDPYFLSKPMFALKLEIIRKGIRH